MAWHLNTTCRDEGIPDRDNGHLQTQVLRCQGNGSVRALEHELGKVLAVMRIVNLAGKAQSPALRREAWLSQGCSQSLMECKAGGR